MARKHDVKNIKLQIDDFEPFINENHTGFIISWSSDIGFGEYTIYKENNKWYGDSECMDSNDEKEFVTQLMSIFIKELEIK